MQRAGHWPRLRGRAWAGPAFFLSHPPLWARVRDWTPQIRACDFPPTSELGEREPLKLALWSPAGSGLARGHGPGRCGLTARPKSREVLVPRVHVARYFCHPVLPPLRATLTILGLRALNARTSLWIPTGWRGPRGHGRAQRSPGPRGGMRPFAGVWPRRRHAGSASTGRFEWTALGAPRSIF